MGWQRGAGHKEMKTTIRILTCVQKPLKGFEQKNIKYFKSYGKESL